MTSPLRKARLLLAFLCLPTLAAAQVSAPDNVRINSWDDIDGDGFISCDEPVHFAIRHPMAAGARGVLTLPTRSLGIYYQAGGSFDLGHPFSYSCPATLLQGNDPADQLARWSFACERDGFLFLNFTARYRNTQQPSFQVGYDLEIGKPSTLTSFASEIFREPREICSGAAPKDVTIVKRSLTPAVPDQILTYSLTATSALGRGGVQLVETVPTSSSFVAASSTPGWVCNPGPSAGSTCRLPIGNLPPGAPVNATFSVRLAATFPAGVSDITNTACALEGPSLLLACATVTDPVAASPDLRLRKSISSGSATPGSLLAWALTVQNLGNQTSTPRSLTETVPLLTTFSPAASSPEWSCSAPTPGSACSLALPAIDPGQSVAYTFAVQTDSTFPASTTAIANTACLGDKCSSSTSPTQASPEIEIEKFPLSLPAGADSLVPYRIVVRNVGNQDAAGVAVTESLPPQTRFSNRLSTPGWTCDAGACTFPIPLLRAGAAVELDFTVQLPNPLPAGYSHVFNRACAFAPAVAEACSEVTIPAGASPRLEVTKSSITTTPARADEVFRWGLRVANTGDQILERITVTETLAHGLTFSLLGSSPGWTCDAGLCLYSIASLSPGSFENLVFAVVPSTDDVLLNTACAAGGLAAHCASTSSPTPAQLVATLNDSLGLDADQSGDFSPGDQILYTLVVENPSRVYAQGVTFDIPAAAHLTLLESSLSISCPLVERTGDKLLLSNIPPDGACTVTFLMEIDPRLPPEVERVQQQVPVSAANALSVLSDDPDSRDSADPTVTPIRRGQIEVIPTLSEIGLILLAGALGLLALRTLRRPRLAVVS